MKRQRSVIVILAVIGCSGLALAWYGLAQKEERFIRRRHAQIEQSLALLARNKEFLKLRLEEEIARQEELLASKAAVEKEIAANNAIIAQQRRALDDLDASLVSLQEECGVLAQKIFQLDQSGTQAAPAAASGNKGYMVRDGRLTAGH